MKKFILAMLAAFILLHAPWRMMMLALEVLNVSPGWTRVIQSDSKYWEAINLERRLIEMGYSVKYTATGEAYGTTDPRTREIEIDADLHWNARYAALAHEGGHTLQPMWMTRNQGEVFAESVAMLVAHDGYREHARYLAKFRAEFLLIAFVEWPAMYRAAALLED